MNPEFSILVPAAGLGTRMGSNDLPKALVPFAGTTLLKVAISSFEQIAREVVLVIRSEHLDQFSKNRNSISNGKVSFVIQDLPTGTANAVSTGLSLVGSEWTLVIWGDHIGASKMIPQDLLQYCNDSETDFILPLVVREDPYVYFGDDAGNSLVLNETKLGATKVDIGTSDCGLFLFRTHRMLRYFHERDRRLDKSNNKDLNFLSLFVEMEKSGLIFKKVFFQNVLLTKGVNSKEELYTMESLFSK